MDIPDISDLPVTAIESHLQAVVGCKQRLWIVLADAKIQGIGE
jgi:hypothetical protein